MNHRPIILKFFEGVYGANQFDLCDVVPCDRFQKKHIRSVKYLCSFANYKNNAGSLTSASCSIWADVVCNTGDSDIISAIPL